MKIHITRIITTNLIYILDLPEGLQWSRYYWDDGVSLSQDIAGGSLVWASREGRWSESNTPHNKKLTKSSSAYMHYNTSLSDQVLEVSRLIRRDKTWENKSSDSNALTKHRKRPLAKAF